MSCVLSYWGWLLCEVPPCFPQSKFLSLEWHGLHNIGSNAIRVEANLAHVCSSI